MSADEKPNDVIAIGDGDRTIVVGHSCRPKPADLLESQGRMTLILEPQAVLFDGCALDWLRECVKPVPEAPDSSTAHSEERGAFTRPVFRNCSRRRCIQLPIAGILLELAIPVLVKAFLDVFTQQQELLRGQRVYCGLDFLDAAHVEILHGAGWRSSSRSWRTCRLCHGHARDGLEAKAWHPLAGADGSIKCSLILLVHIPAAMHAPRNDLLFWSVGIRDRDRRWKSVGVKGNRLSEMLCPEDPLRWCRTSRMGSSDICAYF